MLLGSIAMFCHIFLSISKMVPMKYMVSVLFIVMAAFVGCSKDEHNSNMDDAYFSPDRVTVPLNNCITKKYSGDTTILYCLDSISDNRCPSSLACFWQGVASAKLSININQVQHQVKLCTITHLPFYQNDTTIAGFNFKMIDVTPYPTLPQNTSPNYQAIINVRRL
jgi:hypothetical protein